MIEVLDTMREGQDFLRIIRLYTSKDTIRYEKRISNKSTIYESQTKSFSSVSLDMEDLSETAREI